MKKVVKKSSFFLWIWTSNLFLFVGLFMRQMLLAYNKLSFSQVYKLYKSLQQYCHRGNQPELSALPAEDMELTNTEDPSADRIDKDELDTVSLHQSELRSEGITCYLYY